MKDVESDQSVVQRRKRRDAVENRERILNVARQLFATQGVEATSMNEIAQVAQVGPGTLYRCFAHKSALGEALMTEEIAAFWKQVDATLFPDAPGSALSQLDWFLETFYPAVHQRTSHLFTKAVAQGETVDHLMSRSLPTPS